MGDLVMVAVIGSNLAAMAGSMVAGHVVGATVAAHVDRWLERRRPG